jgi:hypothetical protein
MWGLPRPSRRPCCPRRARGRHPQDWHGAAGDRPGGGYALDGAKIALDRVNKPAAFWENSSNSSPRTTRRPIPAPCSPSPSSRRSRTSSVFLGPVRSTQNHAIANDILKTAKPFCFGGTDPALTKMGNPWMIRFRPNDTYSARVIGSYGVETLGKKNWALVHSTERQQTADRCARQTRSQGRHRSSPARHRWE